MLMKSKLENKIYSIIKGVCQQQCNGNLRNKGERANGGHFKNLITAQTPDISNQCNTYY